MNNRVFKTSDIGLAAYLMKNGCRDAIPFWERRVYPMNGKIELEFCFQDVTPEMISAYRRDDEGFQRLLSCRRTLLRIIKTEIPNARTGVNE